MKQVKKPVQSSSKTSRPEIIKKTNNNNYLKKKTVRGNKKIPAEILLIRKDSIPPEILSQVLQYGISVGPDEDLLIRLLNLQKENQHLQSLSITDGLTSLYNKRFFNKQLQIEVARTRRTGEPFCLAFIDLDNFKNINDTFGHAKGDEFLVNICRSISRNIRPTDFACRYGGDEFTIILPATSLRDGIMIAQRWHSLIDQVAAGMNLAVSSSIGIDEFDTSCKMTAEEFLHKVDQTLYSAKRSGKGKVVHPDIVHPTITESRAVTQAEKETLYNFFKPPAKKRKQTPTVRRKK